ncbi:MAG TPA: GntR family transcriptional regulator [Solirubrobacteraceae bacterium]|nr:GntR family transcriptional regulator [Solirubrobacteraceae bacterium]
MREGTITTVATPLRTTLTDALVEALREEIRSGQLEPGSRLRQADVAQRFHVSTTPVREAFAALEREGLLVSSPHRGVVVFQPSIADLQETYEIRIPLEALATEKGVENMTDQDIERLRELLDQMARAAEDPVRYSKLNLEFHKTIYAPARRPKLEKLILELREASAAYLRLYSAISPNGKDTQREHREIFEACAARAPKRAAKAMTTHLQHTVEFVSRSLAERETPTTA